MGPSVIPSQVIFDNYTITQNYGKSRVYLLNLEYKILENYKNFLKKYSKKYIYTSLLFFILDK